jgi:hypothetical protein
MLRVFLNPPGRHPSACVGIVHTDFEKPSEKLSKRGEEYTLLIDDGSKS